MPGGFPVGVMTANANTFGLVTPTSGAANTKGNWIQAPVPPYDISLLHVWWITFTAGGCLLDIGIGPASSQVVLIPNINLYNCVTVVSSDFYLPVDIKAGSAIWLRTQTPGAGSAAFFIQLDVYGGGATQQAGFSGGDSIGANTATSLGTSLTASTPANTKGAYQQLTAATQRDYAGLIVNLAGQTSGATYNTDIAIGPSGSEVIILPSVICGQSSAISGFFPINIPAGTRIAARVSSSVASRSLYCSCVGVYQ